MEEVISIENQKDLDDSINKKYEQQNSDDSYEVVDEEEMDELPAMFNMSFDGTKNYDEEEDNKSTEDLLRQCKYEEE
jgi:hypothetical protein